MGRVISLTVHFYIKMGCLSPTAQIFTRPKHQLTEDYITGRFGKAVLSSLRFSMATKHIVKSYDADLDLLKAKLSEMGAEVEDQISKASRALLDRDGVNKTVPIQVVSGAGRQFYHSGSRRFQGKPDSCALEGFNF